MDVAELDELLGELRRHRKDHNWVEAKKANREFPAAALETISAFANHFGGLLLLGVYEQEDFAVTGVGDTAAVMEGIQNGCKQLEPPIRPLIDILEHADGTVLAVDIPAAPKSARPCFIRERGPFEGSYIRSGDGDLKLTPPEVAEMLAAKQPNDHSGRPAPDRADLDPNLLTTFADLVRTSPNYAGYSDAEVADAFGAMADGRPTVAGVLVLGSQPEQHLGAARLAYRLLPDSMAPSEVRFAGQHIEGPIGAIVEQTMRRLREDLRIHQVETVDGNVIDRLDVPDLCLREILSNALIHRSLTDEQVTASVSVEVSAEAVRVVSPGGLHVLTDVSTLGLGPVTGVRNLTLVRLAEKVRTSAGDRIIENQSSGIRAADRAARTQGSAPPIFVDYPAMFEVLMLRGPLEMRTETAKRLPRGAAADDRRLIAWAERFESLRGELQGNQVEAASLDARFGARLLSPCHPDEALGRLVALQSIGLLIRQAAGDRVIWRLAASEQIRPDHNLGARPVANARVCVAIHALGGQATRAKVQARLGVRSNKTAQTLLNDAQAAGLIEATTTNPHDPNRAYKLTRSGEAVAKRNLGLDEAPPAEPEGDRPIG